MMEMIDNVSVVILTKNEEAAIGAALDSVALFRWVYVVDSDSSDRTTALARERGAEVIHFRWNGRYPQKKQWSLTNVPSPNDWILFIDADERPSERLVEELQGLSFDGTVGAFDIPISYIWRGRRLRFGHRVMKRALVNRAFSAFPDVGDAEQGLIGEVEGHFQPTTHLAVGQLSGRIDHSDPDPFSAWIARHNRYSDWEAYVRTNDTVSEAVRGARSKQGSLFQRVPFKPATFFIYAYFLRLGFLDGRAGLDYAIANAFYYWMCSVKTSERRRSAPCDARVREQDDRR